MNDESFEQKLVSLRKKAGLSQKKLAEILGVSEDTVANWENGRNRPRLWLWQIKAYGRAVGIDRLEDLPDDLVASEPQEAN